jgi:hypothetical protein
MEDRSAPPEPPEDFPPEIAEMLCELNTHDLRETIIYAQEILESRHEPTLQVQPTTGEQIVSITDHGGYMEVVKRQPCTEGCEECPHGPYLYHVTRELHASGAEKLHWVLIGRQVTEDDEE